MTTGKRIRNLGEIQQGEIQVASWVSALDEDGNIYIANILNQAIRKINSSEKFNTMIKIKTPSMKSIYGLIKIPKNREELAKNMAKLRTSPYTSLAELFVHKSRIYVLHRLKNIPETNSEFLLDVFDFDGKLICWGIVPVGQLQYVGDHFYFITQNHESEFGSIHISQFSLQAFN